MPDVQEVFHMATRKVRPEAGFADRQQDHQRRRQRNRKMGAFAVSAIILAVAVAVLLEANGGPTGIPADQSSPVTPIVTMPTAADFTRIYESVGTIFVEGENVPPVPLTRGTLPKLSPDRTTIAFLRDPRDSTYDKGGDPFVLQVWLIHPDGSGLRKLGQQHECCIGAIPHLKWSPDGSTIVLTGTYKQRIDVATGKLPMSSPTG